MILLAVAALGLTFGMPKLMENSASLSTLSLFSVILWTGQDRQS